jgi:hypothetical protein
MNAWLPLGSLEGCYQSISETRAIRGQEATVND